MKTSLCKFIVKNMKFKNKVKYPKYIIIPLIIFCLVIASQSAYAATKAELIASLKLQIQAILEQIQALQEQLALLTGSSGITGIPSDFIFNTSFDIGDTGDEVKYLQILLNQDPDTKVSDAGAGSPGNETSYYGARTQQAVVRFKQKYSIGTANTHIGTYTLQKLNEILDQYIASPGQQGGGSGEQDISLTEEPKGICGDNIIQTPNSEGTSEVCDTDKLNNKTCVSLGYAGGTLKCSSTCLVFDVSSCVRAASSGGGGGGGSSSGGTATVSNRAPILNNIGNKAVARGSSMSFSISATDPDNDNLAYTASNLPSGSSFSNSSKAFTWTPGTTGTYTMTFTVSDGKLTDSETIIIVVSEPPVANTPPVAQNQNISTDEDDSLSITLSATDANSDDLSYTVLTNPSHGTLSGAAPNLTYSPNANYNGTDSFTFKANDSKADSNTATISITVNPVNDAPILSSIGNKSVNEGSSLSFTVSAADIDNTTLTYSTQNRPTGSAFSSATRTFTWTPTYTQSGTYTMTFIVSDLELTDSETITITVNNVQEPCTPTTCQAQGKNCGTISDNCGGTLSCGTCSAGYTCTDNVCVGSTPVCGDGTCNGTETCSICPGDCGACVTGTYYYVDPDDGNDSNAGTIDKPFKTIEKARDAIRARDVDGVTVYLREGTFYLTQVLTFDQRDSGSAGAPNTYMAYPGEEVTISGGKVLDPINYPWTVTSVNGHLVYKTNVGDLEFNSLWVDDERAVRAREPDEDSSTPYLDYYIIKDNANTAEKRLSSFVFNNNDISGNWGNLNNIEIISIDEWVVPRERISVVDEITNLVSFQAPVRYEIWKNNRYYIENFLEGLDQPGEWYLDYNNGDLYYYPLDDKNPNESEIIIPLRGNQPANQLSSGLVKVDSSEYLMFSGLIFEHTDWYLPQVGYRGYQSAYGITTCEDIDGSPAWYGVPPAILFYNTDGCKFNSNTIKFIGGDALTIRGLNMEVKNNTFVN
ncbi:MAG: Ig-like domain-containing protein, partial [Nitrospira sp.]|nr:Ig-like domain-containing protein [Nitrospira sp.]